MTIIKAKKDLFNGGKCFTAGETYTINRSANSNIDLIDARTINDQGQTHIIGGWWKEFNIIKNQTPYYK